MSKSSVGQKKGKRKISLRNGLTATGFIVAVLIVFYICFAFQVDIKVIIAVVAVVLVIVVGLPLFLFASRENNDEKDEYETCRPLLQSFEKHKSTEKLIEDYRAWQQGEHSTYTRVHFGGDIVYTLQEAKAYEEALAILKELEGINMKSRERYDYETYRDKVTPELLEGIEKEKKRAEERARNKNLRKN